MNTRLRFRSLLSILLLALLAPLGLYAPPIQASTQASTTITDDLNDFSKMFSHSANLTFDTSTSCCGADPKRLDRTTKTVETVIWQLSAITQFTAITYFQGTGADFGFYASGDNVTYTQVTPTRTTLSGTSWINYKYDLTPPAGTNYIKMVFPNDQTHPYSPQIGQVIYTGSGSFSTPTPTPGGPTPTPTSTGPQPIGIPGAWTLKFADEFNGTSLNTADWWPNWVNATSPTQITAPVNTSEAAAYDPAQVTVSGGNLNLAMIANPITIGNKTYPYRSGMINTEGNHALNNPMHQFTFGAFEARINLPASGGAIANWPAFWTDGQRWPGDGEMDIMEGLGGTACYNFHSHQSPPGGCPAGNFTGWHTFASNWQSGRVDYYYDGGLIGSQTSGITNSPMYVILNYAGCVTADLNKTCWGGPVVVPATMQVDYVRVWQ